MLTISHKPIVDEDRNTISIWNDETNNYEVHTFEFIEDLYELIHPGCFDLDEEDFGE